MKKYKILSIVLITVLFISGCGNKHESAQNESRLNDDKIDVNRILELAQDQYSPGPSLNHQNVIYNYPLYSVDKNIKSEINIKLSDNELSAKYKETLYYPVGESTVYKYLVDGDEKKKVLIDNSGNIYSILHKYTFLDISKTASPEEVLPKLKHELSKTVDVSRYSNVEIPKPRSDMDGFGIYEYRFYNEKNGYITDYLMAYVYDAGAVSGVKVRNLPSNDFIVDIDKEKEHEAIEMKMKSIYDTETTKYLSYNMRFVPIIVFYNNEFHVSYSVSANFLGENGEEQGSWIFSIFVPLDMINRETAA